MAPSRRTRSDDPDEPRDAEDATAARRPRKKKAARTPATGSTRATPAKKKATSRSRTTARRRKASGTPAEAAEVEAAATPPEATAPRAPAPEVQPEDVPGPEDAGAAGEDATSAWPRRRRGRTRRGGRRRALGTAATGIPPLPEDDEPRDEVGGRDGEPAPEGSGPRAAEVLEAVREGRSPASALDELSDAEIRGLARAEGIALGHGERRSETLFRLLQRPVDPSELPTTWVEGLLELHPDGYGFLRRPENGYVQHPLDVYVSAGLVRKVGLQAGHWVSGKARPGRPGEHLLALCEVEEVNHEPPERLGGLTPFEELTVVYPDQRFLLEVRPEDVEMRILDLFCPLGRGQRAIITAPPRTGKTVLLQKLADAIAHNSPEVDIVVLLVDERPEEVTNMRRSVRGEVIASTFDKPATNHVRVAELVMEKVKRMVEQGRHVVLLLDSITRLGRAYNNMAGASGRILTGGLDAKALTKPKRFFGAARNVEDGGSLTILATALIQTGSRMDDVIFEEFKGTGNMEIVLDRDVANARIWPAINIPTSGTRNEELLLHPEELRRIGLIRKAMAGLAPQEAVQLVLEQMRQYKTNAELLMSLG